MKQKLTLIIILFSINMNAQSVKFNQVDSTYIMNATSAAKLAYLAEKCVYVDTLLMYNGQLYEIIEDQNKQLSELYVKFDNYKVDSDAYTGSVIPLQEEKIKYYEKQYKSNKKWKWLWIVASTILTGTLILTK